METPEAQNPKARGKGSTGGRRVGRSCGAAAGPRGGSRDGGLQGQSLAVRLALPCTCKVRLGAAAIRGTHSSPRSGEEGPMRGFRSVVAAVAVASIAWG